jgi:hypothetical protein
MAPVDCLSRPPQEEPTTHPDEPQNPGEQPVEQSYTLEELYTLQNDHQPPVLDEASTDQDQHQQQSTLHRFSLRCLRIWQIHNIGGIDSTVGTDWCEYRLLLHAGHVTNAGHITII